MPQLKLYILVFTVFMVASVASCGQTGDLYLPEDDSKQKPEDQPKN